MTTTSTAFPSPTPDDEVEQDFKALLGMKSNDSNNKASATTPSSMDTVPFDTDHLTREKLDLSSHSQTTSPKGGALLLSFVHGDRRFAAVSQLMDRLSAYVSMLCYFYPGACGTLVFLGIGLVLWGLGSLILNPTVEYGVMRHHDHSFLDSEYNVKQGQIDHWCLRGDNNSCQCEDPLQPTSRADRKSWRLAFKTNRKMVKALEAAKAQLDVLFVGESIIEEMDGRWMGQGRSPTLQKMQDLFHSQFSTSEGGKLNAAALGIAGDTAPNVLWRLLHGELPDTLPAPRIVWLSLGNNDLSRMQCSEEVVVLGILRVVEELLHRLPAHSHIVINSLFPMSQIRGSLYPSRTDYQESMVHHAGAMGNNNRQRRRQRHLRVLEESFSSKEEEEEDIRSSPGRHLFGKPRHPVDDPRNPHIQMTEAQAADAEDARFEAQQQKQSKRGGFLWFGNRQPRNSKNQAVLREAHKIHKRDAQLPLWTSILVVNRELRRFAATQERVTFFDVTPLFTLRRSGNQELALRTNLIGLKGHPTVEGFAVWEQAVVQQALEILQDLNQDNPQQQQDLVMPDVIGFDNFDNTDDFADDAFQQEHDDAYYADNTDDGTTTDDYN